MRLPKDSTMEYLKEELKHQRDENKIYGRSDYRRGFIDGLKLAVELRRSALMRGTE